MPLRLLEVTVPAEGLDEVSGLLEETSAVDVSIVRSTDGPGLVRILVDSHDSEAMSDLLCERFESHPAFRLVMLPVEATVPTVEEPEEEAEEPAERGHGPARVSREELYEDVSEASRLTHVYVVMVALSTIVAAVGLLRGDVAIIIGAMVIAPLLGPNIGLSLAATLGDPKLARRALRATAAGVATVAAVALLLGAVLTVNPSVPELAARTRADLGDVALSLAAGAAGTLAFTGGVPAVVVGVMVAVALLPPLVAAGLLFGAGYPTAAFGAVLLVVTNVTCVNLAAIATFLLQKVQPRTWWEADRAKRASRMAMATWIVMLAILIGLMLFGVVETG
ncbi:MAG: TIGR00341 family protein [Gemmatimonadota bacterium]|jgi:uncharacterized hydrophobic protein (TIGR00341 family)